MHTKTTLLALLAAAASPGVLAQRPTDMSICDYYTTALLKNNTAANQLTLLTLVVNTAVIGNYTKPNVGIAVPGILAKGTYNGTEVSLAKYFNGALLSTNEGAPSAVNFLDDGGAAPLLENKPANGTTSRQYALLTHLYSYFGVLTGCTMVGKDGFPAYNGDPSMYNVHKYMGLDPYELGYFITQVGLSAASFGVATADVEAVGKALGAAFGFRCSPAATIVPSQGAHLQSICIASTCPLDAMAMCSAADNNGTSPHPAVFNATLAGVPSNSTASGTASGTASKTGAGSTARASATSTSSGASAQTVGSFAAVVGLIFMAFAL